MTQLSDMAVRHAKATHKPYTLKDGGGLYLNVNPSGTKNWLFRFYWHNQQKRISFGVYPAVDLKKARLKRQKAQELLAQGIDPRQQKCASGGAYAVTFAQYAQRWTDFKLKKLSAGKPLDDKRGGRQGIPVQIERYMRMDMIPLLGEKAMMDITRADVLAVQRKIEARGALSIAEKVRGWLNELFRHAVAEGVIESNPASDLDIVALPQKPTRHNPCLRMTEMPELLAKLHHYQGSRQTQLGLKLLLMTGVRTGELRYAEPHQFDLDNAIWRIPAEDVKQLKRKVRMVDEAVPPYLVPLPTQAVEAVRELLSYMMPAQRYLLCHYSEPRMTISENTLNQALSRMGFKGRLTGHGIRATLSTALNELRYDKDYIEAQLSYADKNQIRGTYNHAEYVEQRREMMQEWADRMDQWEAQGLKELALEK